MDPENINKNLQIKEKAHFNEALDNMIKQITLYKAGHMPEPIAGWMFLVATLRILRCIFSCWNSEIPFKLQEYNELYCLWMQKVEKKDADNETGNPE